MKCVNLDYLKQIEKIKLMADFDGFPYEKKEGKSVSFITKLKKHASWRLSERYNKYNGLQINRSYNEWQEDLYISEETRPSIAVYTCITSNYDIPKEPLVNLPNIDYYLFTDSETEIKSQNWKYTNINNLEIDEMMNLDNIQKNRFIKMHPHLFFKEYDYSLYVDGNVTVISDVTPLTKSVNQEIGVALHRHNHRNCIYNEAKVLKILGKGNRDKINTQINKYRLEGFPKQFGLLEATIILTDLKNQNSQIILQSWWEEFLESKSYRDQLSLPYVLWKSNAPIKKVGTLGVNLYRSSKFFIEHH